MSVPLRASAYLNTCCVAGAAAGCPEPPFVPPVLWPPHAATSMATRQKRVGRNPRVNFLPDLMCNFSLLSWEQKYITENEALSFFFSLSLYQNSLRSLPLLPPFGSGASGTLSPGLLTQQRSNSCVCE